MYLRKNRMSQMYLRKNRMSQKEEGAIAPVATNPLGPAAASGIFPYGSQYFRVFSG